MQTIKSFPNIVYELVTEKADGKAVSQFFTYPYFLRSRKEAIDKFLDLSLDDEIKVEEQFLTLYVRHLPSSERVELLTTATFDSPFKDFKPLEYEMAFYQRENIAAYIAAFQPSRPRSVSVFFPKGKDLERLKRPYVHLFLACQYWVFLGRIRRKMLDY